MVRFTYSSKSVRLGVAAAAAFEEAVGDTDFAGPVDLLGFGDGVSFWAKEWIEKTSARASKQVLMNCLEWERGHDKACRRTVNDFGVESRQANGSGI
jgi:hypothetical protein